jgi:phage gpG-like protein
LTFRIGFNVEGAKVYSRAFETFGVSTADLTEPLTDIAKSLTAAVKSEFATEGAFGGSKWQPLSADYAEWKRKHFPGQPILVRSGDLKRSLTEDGVRELRPQYLVFGSDVPYSGFHQRGKGNNPQREMVVVPEFMQHEWDRFFLRWLRKREREAGLS